MLSLVGMKRRNKKLTIQKAAKLLASRGLELRHNESTPTGTYYDVAGATGELVAEHVPARTLGLLLSNL